MMNDKILLLILSLTGSPEEAADIATLVDIESSWVADAVSPVGAVGLLQIMPIAHVDVMDRIKPAVGKGDLMDPEYNLKIGLEYWRWIRSTSQGKPEMRALACWNWGYGNTRRWGGEFPALPRETQDFIRKFRERRKKYAEAVNKVLTH